MTTISISVSTLAIEPVRKNSAIDCVWAMPKAEGSATAATAMQTAASAQNTYTVARGDAISGLVLKPKPEMRETVIGLVDSFVTE